MVIDLCRNVNDISFIRKIVQINDNYHKKIISYLFNTFFIRISSPMKLKISKFPIILDATRSV